MSNWSTVYTATLPVLTTFLGFGTATWSEILRERRRARADAELRIKEGERAASDRRRDFEIPQLTRAYDAVFRLVRQSMEMHLEDARMANAEMGYGRAPFSIPAGSDISVGREATESVRLILDDRLREAAHEAISRLNAVGMLGVAARATNTGPVSVAEGEAAIMEATTAADAVMDAIAARIRAVVASG
jgi:hypothetical protein